MLTQYHPLQRRFLYVEKDVIRISYTIVYERERERERERNRDGGAAAIA
jgi:hypothetical protein